jgi:hypothetical protein
MPYGNDGRRDFCLDQDAHIWYEYPPHNRAAISCLDTAAGHGAR